MAWREERGNRPTVVTVLVVTVCLGLGLPASAHNGEHAVVLTSDEEVGPFLVTAWTTDSPSTGEVPIAVDLTGDYVGSQVEVVVHASASGSPRDSVVLAPATWLGPGVWEGAVTVESGGRHQLVIEIIHPEGRFVTAPLTMTVAITGGAWGVVVAVFAVQAFVFLGWQLSRTTRVWRRAVVKRDVISLAKGVG